MPRLAQIWADHFGKTQFEVQQELERYQKIVTERESWRTP
jgi:hypothetical protein